MTGRIPNPYVVGRAGLSAVLPPRVCFILEAELRRELADLRVRARGVDPELSYALLGLQEAAESFVPPEEQQRDRSSEQAAGSQWLSTTEAAELLGLSTSRGVTLAIKRERLPAVWVGRSWRIRRSDVETYRDQRSMRGEPDGTD